MYMTSLNYGHIFCLESQKIDGTYQRYNHLFFFLLNFFYIFQASRFNDKKTLLFKANLL